MDSPKQSTWRGFLRSPVKLIPTVLEVMALLDGQQMWLMQEGALSTLQDTVWKYLDDKYQTLD